VTTACYQRASSDPPLVLIWRYAVAVATKNASVLTASAYVPAAALIREDVAAMRRIARALPVNARSCRRRRNDRW